MVWTLLTKGGMNKMSPGSRLASQGFVLAKAGKPSDSNTSILELEAPGAKDRRFTSEGGKRSIRLEP